MLGLQTIIKSDLLLLCLHSILEVFPISSSWHLSALGASSAAVHSYHIWLLPIVTLYSLWEHRRSGLLRLPLGTILASIFPTALCYILIKNQLFLTKVKIPMAQMHFFMGLLLMAIAYNQLSGLAHKRLSTNATWIVSGLLQSLAVVFSGSSRLGTSLLYALYYKIDFHKAFVISFTLNLITLSAGFTLDVLLHKFVIPSLLELCLASVSFIAGLYLAYRGQWWFIGACGFYRVLLGLGMLIV